MGEWYARVFGGAIVEESAAGLSIASAPGRYVTWALAFLMLFLGAWWCRRRKLGGNLAHGAFYASFVIPLLILPGIALESVHLSSEELSIRTGLWFAPTTHRIPITGVVSVSEQERAVQQRRVAREDVFWRFLYRDGTKRSLRLPDLLEANRALAIDHLRRLGIAFAVE